MRFIAVYLHNSLRFFTRVSCICTKILLRPDTRLSNSASSALCEKLASKDDFEIVVRQIENLETHVFEISVSVSQQ